MSFASRIAAFKSFGTLVVGWQCDGTQAHVNTLRRSVGGVDNYQLDLSTPPIESGSSAIKCGWNSGTDTDQPRGEIGGQGAFYWKNMKAQYGSPGVNHRFTQGDTMGIQWGERYGPSFIGLASRCDSGFKGGIKTNMIDLELGTANTGTGLPDQTGTGWTTNSTMELVVSSYGTVTPFSAADPTKANQTSYYSALHIPMASVSGAGTLGLFRPDRWAVYTVRMDIGTKWAIRYYAWQRSEAADPSHQYNVLNDYRNTDSRWHLSSQQAAALAAGDAVALAAAPYNQSPQHRFRMWVQYSDWAEPLLLKDATFWLHNPYKWGAPEDPWEAAYGQCSWSTLAYQAGAVGAAKGLTNVYGNVYTPYMQFKRPGDSFPDPFGPAATHGAYKWYDGMIVNRGAIDPKFYGGSDPEDPPPTLPDAVSIPSGISVVGTP